MAKHITFGKAVNDAERWAFELLRQNLPEGYLVLTNLEIMTHSGQVMEIDALVVGQWGIYIVDIKGYIGCLDATLNAWSLDGRCIDNSLAKVNYIAKVLATKIKHKIPVGVYAPWCQGVVLLTGRKGEEISLRKSEKALSIYTPSDIVSALTNEWGSRAPHKHRITENQKSYVLDTIGQVALVEQRNNRINDFEKKKCLFEQNGLEIWEAIYNPGDWQASWLLKILTLPCFEDDYQFARQETRLRSDFAVLQQLSGCSGVPYTAPLIQDGEQLVLPIKMPRGVPLSLFDTDTIDAELLLSVLRQSVTSLQQIHRRGVTVGGWHPNSVFVSKEGDVEFIDINGLSEIEYDIQQYALTFLPMAQATHHPVVIRWFEDMAKGKVHHLDALRSELSAIIAEGIIEPVPSVEIKPGAIINHCYELQERVRCSPTSELWKARHRQGNFLCGLSVYRSVTQSWPSLYSVYSSLNELYHPNVERVLQFGQLSDDGDVFIARAWFDGLGLHEVDQSLIVSASGHWFKQLLVALEYLHSVCLCHGAICPDNIICNELQAVLVNFGVGLDIAADSYCKEWADPVLWAEEGSAEKDLFGLVASFIDVLSRPRMAGPFRRFT